MRHRRRPDPVDPAWEATAVELAGSWTHLDDGTRDRWLADARAFDRSKLWEPLDQLDVTPEIRATVSVLATLLTVEIGPLLLADVTSVILSPRPTTRTTRHAVAGGIVSEGTACVLGEALLHGPIRVTWKPGSPARNQPVILHEFAHKIDMADGITNGTPPIADRSESLRFERVMAATLDRLRDGPRSPALRPYASTSPTELFAVATETLFLDPDGLASGHPDLFAALAGFYRQRPRRSDVSGVGDR